MNCRCGGEIGARDAGDVHVRLPPRLISVGSTHRAEVVEREIMSVQVYRQVGCSARGPVSLSPESRHWRTVAQTVELTFERSVVFRSSASRRRMCAVANPMKRERLDYCSGAFPRKHVLESVTCVTYRRTWRYRARKQPNRPGVTSYAWPCRPRVRRPDRSRSSFVSARGPGR